jgi:hypothetical protein
VNTPTDICNRVLDLIGSEITLGDVEDGSREGQVLLRAYQVSLVRVLRAAHWRFARKTEPLVLLADSTGQTPNVGTAVPGVWVYEYALPTDCAQVIGVPINPANFFPGVIPPNNIALPNPAPLPGTSLSAWLPPRLLPAPFEIAIDSNYSTSPATGPVTWETRGVAPVGRSVILSNVPGAFAIYTSIPQYPSLWDDLFRDALEHYIAQDVALPLTKDKRLGLQIRAQETQIAKARISQARAANANEGWNNTTRDASWITARRMRGAAGPYFGSFAAGGFWSEYQGIGFADGTIF